MRAYQPSMRMMTESPKVRPRWRLPVVIPALVGCGVFLTFVPWGFALLFPASFVIVVLIGMVAVLSRGDLAGRSLLVWTLISFVLHLLVGVFITHTNLLSYFGPDAMSYHEGAIGLTREWHGSVMNVSLSSGKEGFYYLLAGLYWAFGAYPISGLVVNAGCAAALIPVSSLTTFRLFGEKSARWVAALLTLTPSFLIWPSQLLREAPILLLIAVAAASAVALTTNPRFKHIGGLIAALLVLFTFRSSVAMLMTAGLLVGIAFGLRRLWIGLSLQVAVLGIMVILIAGVGLGYSGFKLASRVDLGDVEAFRSATAEGAGSAFAAGDVSSPAGAAATLPIGIGRVLLGPFPWEIGLRQVPALVDGLVMWALFVPLLIGIRRGWTLCGRRLLPLLIPGALLSALLAVVIGNYGLLLRERTQVLILLVPLIAHGLERAVGPRPRNTIQTS